jgi:hypothetical protein
VPNVGSLINWFSQKYRRGARQTGNFFRFDEDFLFLRIYLLFYKESDLITLNSEQIIFEKDVLNFSLLSNIFSFSIQGLLLLLLASHGRHLLGPNDHVHVGVKCHCNE